MPSICSQFCSSFLFQAEDGIRGSSVTGVQTCALPISTLLSAVAIILATELRIFNSILATTPLTAAEWATCPEIGRASCREGEQTKDVTRLLLIKHVSCGKNS